MSPVSLDLRGGSALKWSKKHKTQSRKLVCRHKQPRPGQNQLSKSVVTAPPSTQAPPPRPVDTDGHQREKRSREEEVRPEKTFSKHFHQEQNKHQGSRKKENIIKYKIEKIHGSVSASVPVSSDDHSAN